MEKKLLDLYDTQIIDGILAEYGTSFDKVELVGNHQSCVYKAKLNGNNIYIRITLGIHRKRSEILAELEIIAYLRKHNFDVVESIRTVNGALIYSVTFNGIEYHSVAFTEAEGLGVGVYPWSIQVPFRVGVMIGTLHNLLSSIVLKVDRKEWYDNIFLVEAKSYLPKGHDEILKVIDEIVDEIRALPYDDVNYGLIHGDILAPNYHMTDDKITLFDFDELSYCWYVNDIAINIFYSSLGWKGTVDVEDTIESYLEMIKGYKTVRNIDEFWISKIPLFLKLRELILYVAVHRSQDLSKLDSWTQNFMKDRKSLIERRVPFIDLDFLGII